MATLKLFRCTRVSCVKKDQGRFQSEGWACPQCGLPMKDPKLGDKIMRLTMVHFDPPSEWPGMGLHYRACDPSIGIQVAPAQNGMPNPWHAGTGDPRQVSCPKCKDTEAYKKALATAEDEDENGQTIKMPDGEKPLPSAVVGSLERMESFRTR